MSDLATLGPEVLAEIKAEAPEALRTIIYRHAGGDIPDISAVPDKLKFGEADGEVVKITDTVWLVFAHEIPGVKPHADDWILEGGNEHFVIQASADDPAGILWRVITKG